MALPLQLTRLHAVVAGLLVLAAATGGGLYAHFKSPAAAVHAHLQVGDAKHVPLMQPVLVKFDRPVDLSHTSVKVDPPAKVVVQPSRDQLVLAPVTSWDPDRRYRVVLGRVTDAKHSANPLVGWSTVFTTAGRASVAAFKVNGKPATEGQLVRTDSKFSIQFSGPMKPATVIVELNGAPLAQSQLAWAPGDATDLSLSLTGLLPYQPLQLSVRAGAQGTGGETLVTKQSFNLVPGAVEPTNPSSGIGADFKPVSPIMIVVENAGEARPQSGLQQADMVFEYVSEYSISRMTAVYFNAPPALVGPVRSCRMINIYLGFAFRGDTMCSGASNGTVPQLLGPPRTPVTVNDWDYTGSFFFRSSSKFAPHNLFTSGSRAVAVRPGWGGSAPDYVLDPSHPDSTAGATPSGAPSVAQHFVTYAYDDGAKVYRRYDHGAASIDAETGGQISPKNVVVVHTPYHDAGWVEDDNGGAHSVWYDLNGTGAAEIYSDGTVISGAWHMGAGNGQGPRDNHDPMWFSDQAGNPVELNSGLTWIHVVGNGQ